MPNKLRKCTGCKERFPQESMIQKPVGWFHNMECAISYAIKVKDKQKEKQLKKLKARQKKQAREDRKEIRQRREALKTLPQLIKEAQKEFNRYIRSRDKDEDCISCGRTNKEVEATDGWKTGGAWDCGHYRTVGSCPELRFEPKAAYKQCKSCNSGSYYHAHIVETVKKKYRNNLIERKGQELVDWLEGPHEAKNYTHDELREIKKHFRIKANELA